MHTQQLVDTILNGFEHTQIVLSKIHFGSFQPLTRENSRIHLARTSFSLITLIKPGLYLQHYVVKLQLWRLDVNIEECGRA